MERYIKFIVVVIIIFSPILANAHPEDYKNFRKIDMNVYKDGKIIGFSNYIFNYDNKILEVINETKFVVNVLGLKVFSIQSRGQEKYFKNKLISYKSKTMQNEKEKYVNLKLSKNKNVFEIEGSSYKGISDTSSIIGNWWNHDILEAKSQISPLSGSIKKQIVSYIGEEIIKINKTKYITKHYKIISKNSNTPENKKLNFDIWYDEEKNLIIKVSYEKLGNWEYKLKNYE
tara:strand:- start:970 stop:1659 length:690 start_codon:yes stop_codon:yes gene_type:complete